MNAVHVFASDPNGEPLGFDQENDDHEPVDNLAAPVGVISAVIIGLLLWVVIIAVVLWIK